MISAWHKTRSRLAQMSWDELQTRVRHGISKRFDLAKYRSGMLTHTSPWNKQSSTAGTFFFSKEDLPQLTTLLREHLSGEAKRIVHEADEICAHRFRLLGFENVDYGPKIDWHLDAVHGKRAPLKPWYKIDFLNFSVVGDHKVTWELNRHQHLVTLAKASALSHEEAYATELIRQWYAWRLANPFPLGINWSSSLEVGFRSLSWLWVRFLLAECSAVPASFEQDLLQALALNGSYIERYLSTYFSPNTHLLGEAVALFFIGTLCPQIRLAERWRSCGWRMVLDEAERQVRSDGVHFEQALHYHVYALDFFLHARVLAGRNGLRVPLAFDATLGRMLDFLQAISQAGPPASFGDDDGGRVFDPSRNRGDHLTDPLAIGAILFERADLRSAVSLTEEALWLLGPQAVSCFAEPHPRPALNATSFEASGIHVMTSSERCAHRLVIDAGPMGTGRGGHAHADALSITMSFGGRPWLIDPGTFGYVTAGKERDYFRGTSAHNTLTVDGQDQAIPDGSFSWISVPDVHTERWLAGKTFSLFAGSHTGFCRLPDPVLHRRFVFHLHGGFWLVRDLVGGREPHRVDVSWHFASDLNVREVEGLFLAVPDRRGVAGDARLALVSAQEPGWTCALDWGEVSPVYGRKDRGPVLRMSGRICLPAECAMLIVPLLHPSDKPGSLTRMAEQSDTVRAYAYDDDGSIHSMIFSSGHEGWTLGQWTSDAGFIYCRVRDGKLEHFILCDGSFATLSGQSVLTHFQKVERFEWLNQTGEGRVLTSDDESRRSFSEEVLQTCVTFF